MANEGVLINGGMRGTELHQGKHGQVGGPANLRPRLQTGIRKGSLRISSSSSPRAWSGRQLVDNVTVNEGHPDGCLVDGSRLYFEDIPVQQNEIR